MAELINAKCPNCGAVLELPSKLDRAFCIHCGGKVIIAKDIYAAKPAIACPECGGKGYLPCHGEMKEVRYPFKQGWIIKTYIGKFPCRGTGKCTAKYTNTKDSEGNLFFGIDLLFSSVVCKDGKCNRCHGKGVFTGGGKCDMCKGTKTCFVCKGTDKCTFCNGTGKMKCKACNGTGFKIYEGE